MTERNPIPPTSSLSHALAIDTIGCRRGRSRDRVVLTLLVSLQDSCPRVPEHFVSIVYCECFAGRFPSKRWCEPRHNSM